MVPDLEPVSALGTWLTQLVLGETRHTLPRQSGRRRGRIRKRLVVLLIGGALVVAVGVYGLARSAGGGGQVTVESGSLRTRERGDLTISYVVRNNLADQVDSNSTWTLSPEGQQPTWNNRVFEGQSVSGSVPAEGRVTRTWSGHVDAAPGRYRISAWVRKLRQGRWLSSGSRTIGMFEIGPKARQVVRFRAPFGPSIKHVSLRFGRGRIPTARIDASVTNPGPEPAAVNLVWGLEPIRQPRQARWFEHPVVPVGSPASVTIPAKGVVHVVLVGAAKPPRGRWAVRLAVLLNLAGAANHRTGPALDDLLIRAARGRVTRGG